MHTDLSDGRLGPHEVLARCLEGRLDVVAITDHDLPPHLPHGDLELGGRRIRVVHAAEVSGMHEGSEQHLLVYFRGLMPLGFRRFLRDRARARAHRHDEARRRLGLDGLEPADAAARAGLRALTRHHLSVDLVRAGHARNLFDAYDRFTGARRGLVPDVDVSFVQAIQAARDHGGLPVWAHPDPALATRVVGSFARAGLRGIEVWRARGERGHHRRLGKLAASWKLIPTGGSDFHGWGDGRLGDFAIDGHQAAAFERWLHG